MAGLQGRLPLEWSTAADTPPSPKKSYRSAYQYMGWGELGKPASWGTMSEFDIMLRLVDFSGIRDELAQCLGWTSAKGQVPYDPVSLFLLHCWQIFNGWSRAKTLRNLSKPRYADYAQLFGFQQGVFPTEGGLRHFLTVLGENSERADKGVSVHKGDGVIEIAVEQLNQIIAQSVELIRNAGVLSETTWQQALICPDGQIHEAASRMRCQTVTESCYEPGPRPCPAKAKGSRGCDCDSLDCALICKRATPQDPQARFVWYTGNNQDDEKDGEGYFGYRSLPLQLVDRERRFSITLLDDVLPANQREEKPGSALLLQLAETYPDLKIDAVAGDAGFGYEVFLHTIYGHLQARRVVALRSHKTDENQEQWLLRGYDDYGRPICPYGYGLVSNGYDRTRQRTKWICQRTCLKGTEPRVQLPEVSYPPPDCPYQAEDHPYGRVINLAERFPDGSIRLVRDAPGFERLPVYALFRSKALLFLADVLNNLTTLARLIQEATLAHHDL
jgi:hypothetical protein